MKLSSVFAALLVVTPLVAQADDKNTDKTTANDKTTNEKNTKLSDTDLKLVAELHHADQSEVAMANYVLAHGTHTVKSYATMMIKDHSTNDRDLTALARRHGLSTIPAATGQHDDMDDMTKLKSAKGAALDRVYIDMMVADHEKDVKKVTDAIGTLSDPELKAFFAATLPVLERHLEAAKNLQKSAPQASK